jgi:hypothetical protein
MVRSQMRDAVRRLARIPDNQPRPDLSGVRFRADYQVNGGDDRASAAQRTDAAASRRSKTPLRQYLEDVRFLEDRGATRESLKFEGELDVTYRNPGELRGILELSSPCRRVDLAGLTVKRNFSDLSVLSAGALDEAVKLLRRACNARARVRLAGQAYFSQETVQLLCTLSRINENVDMGGITLSCRQTDLRLERSQVKALEWLHERGVAIDEALQEMVTEQFDSRYFRGVRTLPATSASNRSRASKLSAPKRGASSSAGPARASLSR